MRLNIYFSKKIILIFSLTFFVFLFFSIFLNWIDILRFDFSKTINSRKLFYLAVLKTPITVHPLIPVITLLTSLTFFVSISRNSELIIIRSAGRSILRSLLIPTLTILFLGVFVISALNPISTIMYKLYEAEVRSSSNSLNSYSLEDEGIWLREGFSDGQRVVHARSIAKVGATLNKVTIFEFDKDRIPNIRISAKTAIVKPNSWTLKDGKIWKVNRDNRPEDRAKSFNQYTIKTDLNFEKIRLGFGEPNQISIWELGNYIKRIEKAGFSTLKHKVYLNCEIALPFLMIGMFLIGGMLNMGHSKLSKTGLMLIVTIVLGIGAFLLNNLTQILSQNGAIPILLGAWAPPFITILISLGVILHLEDG
ncbi:MAG: LptF/LptG family permease [Paracoccaceae bacterium]|nr:LptF/LptG family permease [Paracoccaceae bacterium]